MIFFLRDQDGYNSEYYYEGGVNFVREVTLTNRLTGRMMTGTIFFEADIIEFVTNDYDFQTFQVVSIIPDEF